MDWISVKDRLPEREQHDYVLVCCTMNVTSTINYENTTVDQEAQEAASLTELKETLSGAPESMGGLFNAFSKAL